jgi:hypothetical protein
LIQNVPDSARNEQLEDIAAFLLTTLRHTDSSLVEEWEAMRSGIPLLQAQASSEPAAVRKKDLAKDPKALAARARAEMHQLVRLLARKEWEAAAEQLQRVETKPEAQWTPAALETAMAPYFAEHATLDTTPKARQPVLTQLVPDADRTWTVRHAMIDAAGEQDWYIEGTIDLVGRPDVDGALITVHHIGK